MAVVTPELKSFVTKFADLWHSGKNASLSLECDNGEATINLQLRLGSHPLQQPQHHQGSQHRLERRAGPSRLRRRARRAQARELAAERAAAAAEQASASSSTRTNNPADQAALTPPPRAEKAVQVDVLTLPVEKAGTAEHPSGKVNADAAVQTVLSVNNAAVQVDRPVLGLLPPHAMQGDNLPPPLHLPLPAVLVPDEFCPDLDYQDSPVIPKLDNWSTIFNLA